MTIHDEVMEQLHALRDYVRWGASRLNEAGVFFGHGTDNAVDESLHLVLHALHLAPGLPSELMPGRLTRAERRAVIELLERRINERLPAAYLTHEAWFAGLSFYVDERVLVPRSPIAELIERQFQPWLETDVTRVLDLCAGSGCIGIACAHAFPDAEVDAADISSAALAVCGINIERHHMQERVHAVESDLFAALRGRRYDLIVSNPPYVSEAEMKTLPIEYRHEPALGLAAGEQGLDVVRRILREASDYLSDEGLLVVEVGNSELALLDRYPDVPFVWPGFSRGGDGVFLLDSSTLRQFRHLF